MEDKDMIETEEAYYDGTRDEEETEEVKDTAEEDADEADDSDDDGDEEYFDLDDEEEPIEDEDSDEDQEDEGSDAEDEDDEGDDKSEDGDDAKENPDKSSESELLEAVKGLLKAAGAPETTDVIAALGGLTAEVLGISPEEYARRVAAEKAAKASWEAQMQRDIDDIHEAFPVTKKYKTLKDLPNKEAFAALMDDKTKKLTAVQAFAASHTDIVKAHSKAPGKGSDLRGTKDHMKSNVPKGAKDTSTYISKGEMEAYREMFPGLSDKEIKKLYKTANK